VKNKFYNFLLVGVSLAVFASHVDAKTAHGTAKKTAVKVLTKQSKKTVAKSAKKSTAKLTEPSPIAHLKKTSSAQRHTKKTKPEATRTASLLGDKKSLKNHAGKQLAQHHKATSRSLHQPIAKANKHSTTVPATASKQHRVTAQLMPTSDVQTDDFEANKLTNNHAQPLTPEVLEVAQETKIPHLPSQNKLVKIGLDSSVINYISPSEPPLNAFNDTVSEAVSAETLTASGAVLTAHAVITTTLTAAAQNAGISSALMDQLITIFAWDIDFANDLHRGDQFTLVYQSGNNEHVIAAEFVSQGRALTAVHYRDLEGNVNYYTPEGKAMRKAFLSSPVDYVRISSPFDANRRHPILNRIRAHKGVDYAARTGTPVKAAGDGHIAFIGRKGGYGQVMILQHGEHYETLYAHLSAFKDSLLQGDDVKQGDIIAYVGQTGLATGPHLHYEFRVDGQHRNPEEQTAPRHLMTLNGRSLGHFKGQAQPVLAQLYSAKARTLWAKNQTITR
jgi:murein DD-endopeptidase MepM/ murein hydrolase activator NlpD